MQTTISAATPARSTTQHQMPARSCAGITPQSMKTANRFHPTNPETTNDKRETQRIAARALRLTLTARACRRINNALKERKQAAARKADRA